MNKNIVNTSKKQGYRIPFRLTWFRAAEESIIKELALKKPVELDIFITDDSNIRKLNRNHRNIDKATDVLSFYMQEEKPGTFISPPDGILHLGEIVISLETAIRDAGDRGVSLEEELQTLLIHGTLHLLGYDHEKAADGRVMRKKEDEIFRAMACNNPKA